MGSNTLSQSPKISLASNIENAVDRETVLEVLAGEGVSVSYQAGGEPGMLVLAKGDALEVRRIPEVVRKNLLHRLARRFDFPIANFYNPKKLKRPN